MASVQSPLRKFVKPILYKALGRRGYLYAQYFAKLKDIRHRLVEEKEMELLPKLIRSGDEVLDIGANYAYYSVRLAELVGKSGKVYAFEPIPFTYEVCAKILRHFRHKNVELYKLGVGAKTEEVMFNVPVLDFGGISAGQAHFGNRTHPEKDKEKFYKFKEHTSFPCQVVNLDSFLLEKLKHLSFIKMDIEGAEFFALQGMEKLIQKFQPSILIEIQPYFLEGFKIQVSDFMHYLKHQLAYQVYYYDSQKKGLKLLEGDPWDNNYILLPESRLSEFQSLVIS